MDEVGCDFDALHVFDADIVSIDVSAPRTVIAEARNVLIVPSPMAPVTAHLRVCRLVFEGVTSSRRRFHAYTDETHSAFLPPEVVVDVAAEPRAPSSIDFHLEGSLLDPVGWVDNWTITATRVRIFGEHAP